MEKNISENSFSFYVKPVKNKIPCKTIDLEILHSLIISDEYKELTMRARSLVDRAKKEPDVEISKSILQLYKSSKENDFDYVTLNGTFSQRSDDAIIKSSNLFTIDIDHIGQNIIAIKKQLVNDTVLNPQLIFLSPSGDGLKIVVRIDTSVINFQAKSKKMGEIWQAVNNYFGRTYNDLLKPNSKGDFIDGACKDISRACFICFDAEAHLNINPTVLGTEFIEAQINVAQKKTESKKSQYERIKKVSPKTTLDDLAERHLLKKENHHTELLSFISAAKNIGKSSSDTYQYIVDHVDISKDSAHSDRDKLKKEVNDIYDRYKTDSEDVVYITPLEFAYKILSFKYKNEASDFVLTNLFMDGVRTLLHEAGFAKRKMGKNSFIYIQKKGSIISEVTPEIMKDYVLQYILKIEDGISFTYQDRSYQIPREAIRETYFRNSHNIFNATWLQQLQINNDPILKDSKNEMYFSFKNTFVTVSKDDIKYDDLMSDTKACIWDTQIIQHDFNYIESFEDSHFYKFLNNVTNQDEKRFQAICSGIGYLLHHYFNPSEGQAVVFYDESITDSKTPMGGTGKGLIIAAIKQVRNVAKIDGKHLDSTNRFRWEQVTPSTQVVWLDDTKPDFDFSILHSNLTDGWTIERKNVSQFFIESVHSPKTVICSNSILKGGGSTNKRRQNTHELSDFYSKQIVKGDEKPIEDTHGCIFYSDTWQDDEWNKFFSFMLNIAATYLSSGLINHGGINIALNRLKQATNDDFVTWALEKGFEKNTNYETTDNFNQFVNIYYGETHRIGQRGFSGFLKEYAAYKCFTYMSFQSNGTSYFKFT
jgi:hypothetical protein